MLLSLHGCSISAISRRQSHSNLLIPLALTIFLLPYPSLIHNDAWASHAGIELCYQVGLETTQPFFLSFWLVVDVCNALCPLQRHPPVVSVVSQLHCFTLIPNSSKYFLVTHSQGSRQARRSLVLSPFLQVQPPCLILGSVIDYLLRPFLTHCLKYLED